MSQNEYPHDPFGGRPATESDQSAPQSSGAEQAASQPAPGTGQPSGSQPAAAPGDAAASSPYAAPQSPYGAPSSAGTGSPYGAPSPYQAPAADGAASAGGRRADDSTVASVGPHTRSEATLGGDRHGARAVLTRRAGAIIGGVAAATASAVRIDRSRDAHVEALKHDITAGSASRCYPGTCEAGGR